MDNWTCIYVGPTFVYLIKKQSEKVEIVKMST